MIQIWGWRNQNQQQPANQQLNRPNLQLKHTIQQLADIRKHILNNQASKSWFWRAHFEKLLLV